MDNQTNKFQFYEVVIVMNGNSIPDKFIGSKGVVLGMVQDNGDWFYSVALEKDDNFCWDFCEQDLRSTGEFMNRSDFYSGESIRVVVNPKTGEGRINEDWE